MLTPLEQATLDIINRVYNCTYVGKLKLEIINDNCYKLTLGLHTPEKPLIIAMEGDDESYKKFIEQELRTRRLDKTKFYSGYKKEYNEK